MLLRSTNGNLINPSRMEMFTIIEENGLFYVSGIVGNNRYDLIYTNNRPEAEGILMDIYNEAEGGFARGRNIDFGRYIRKNFGRNQKK